MLCSFLSKIDLRAPDKCWPWLAARNVAGYGQFSWRHEFKGIASRACWHLFNGPIPKGAHVLHSCDNPPCVNPNHLFLGTDADNARDAMAKGRNSSPPILRGAANNHALLNEEAVHEIRAADRNHGTAAELARKYGVIRKTIYDIRDRKTWRHI